ncbi:thiopeptide-type bacteriocin biosynthesis protein [Glycomyces harbinensis]|uniref:Thiopeptide-type bacteriocin biosynthesis domain-containing protein n=1 Tax=Glycomyces harbinensis TaxID=58114 RepID=A0A1G6Y8Z0_9ACTN|nr:thiopeptide-type bacteriocin biosynthesis protein [Glycomyces harbinensis]SDD86964.1 thiopeptide-type bacteriocin biosynthesis domain-containing protein [Glycomyces harbinensis]
MDRQPPTAIWLQTNVRLVDPTRAERYCADILWPAIWSGIEDNVLGGWFFVRKTPWWRLRYRAALGVEPERARALVTEILSGPQSRSYLAEVTHQIYEPEVAAFGGLQAMDIAHRLFNHDSGFVGEYLTHQHLTHGTDRRRELSLLLCTAMTRAAGQEWYEHGDIWARLANIRGTDPHLPADPDSAAETAWHLLTADPDATLTRLPDPLAYNATGALTEYRSAGIALRSLADRGHLERGLRDVLAHHILFAWNRIGLAIPDQQALARAARDAVFTSPRTHAPTRQSRPERNQPDA